MRRLDVWAAVFLFALTAGAASRLQGQAMQPETKPEMKMDAGTPAPPAGPLVISFAGKSSTWTADTLAALPHKTITLYNEHVKASQTYSGVELIDLLKPLGVPDKPHGKEFRLYLVAEAADGYQVVYSLGEVAPDVHQGTVMVADQMDGKPIAGNGPLQMVLTGEARPARWVKNLAAIRVRTAD